MFNVCLYGKFAPCYLERQSLLNLGKPVAEVAQDLEVSTSMLYEWRHKARNAASQASSPKLTPCGGRWPASWLRTTF